MNGIEYKRRQYVKNDTIVQKIELLKLIDKFFIDNTSKHNKNIPTLINLKKDTDRYAHAVDQLKYLDIPYFNHLHGTYFRDEQQLIADLNFVLQGYKTYNTHVTNDVVAVDNFSTISDKNIWLQGGPLGCYISHVKAMLHGYSTNTHYTIIMEDDFCINSTKIIEEYIVQIPDDWDIIFFNCITKNDVEHTLLHKIVDEFHSSHFYIIKNTSMPKIFSVIYPIVEQIDVLLSNARSILNMYNIRNTVYQKEYSTNTQNNLYTIFTSSNYKHVVNHILNIEIIIHNMLHEKYPTSFSDDYVSKYIIYDVLFRYIKNCDIETVDDYQEKTNYKVSYNENIYVKEYALLIKYINEILVDVKKGVDQKSIATNLTNYIFHIIDSFETNGNYNILGYGSSSNIYYNGKYVVKQILKISRWNLKEETANDIFLREVQSCKLTNNFIKCNKTKLTITQNYKGCPLINNFVLPLDWKEQIINIFEMMTKENIVYPEFNIFNILICNDKLSFVDYGMANIQLDTYVTKSENIKSCNNFINILEELNEKFETSNYDKLLMLLIYLEYIDNLKNNKCPNIY